MYTGYIIFYVGYMLHIICRDPRKNSNNVSFRLDHGLALPGLFLGSLAICNDTVLISNKPSTSGTIQDAAGDQTYQWTVPFNECGVTASLDSTDSNNIFTKYDLYLNSNRKVFKK